MAATETTDAEILADADSQLVKPGKQLTLFEGKRYPDVDVRLAGGIKGDADLDGLLSTLASGKIGSTFTLTVHGYVAAKKHALTFDADDGEVHTLVVTLKVDKIDQP